MKKDNNMIRMWLMTVLMLIAGTVNAQITLESQLENATVTWYSDAAATTSITTGTPGNNVYLRIQPAAGYWTSANELEGKVEKIAGLGGADSRRRTAAPSFSEAASVTAVSGQTYAANGEGIYQVTLPALADGQTVAQIEKYVLTGTIIECTAISNATVTNDHPTYNGSSVTAAISFNGAARTKGSDYTVTTGTDSGKDAGTMSFTITGAGKFKGTATLSLTVDPKTVGLEWSTPTIWTYDKTEHAPTVTVTGVITGDSYPVAVIVQPADASSSLTNGKAIEAGNYTAIATATDATNKNYQLPTGTPDPTKKDFTINPAEPQLVFENIIIPFGTYSVTPEAFTKESDGEITLAVEKDDTPIQTDGKIITIIYNGEPFSIDYEFTITANQAATKNYTATSTTFTISFSQQDININTHPNVEVKLDGKPRKQAIYIYSGEEWKPEVGITVNGEEITRKDFNTVYSNNKNVGIATIEIAPKPDAPIRVGGQIQFTIEKADLTIRALKEQKTYGETDPTLSYTIHKGKEDNVETAIFNGVNLTGTLTRKAGENVGEYDIERNTLNLPVADRANYNITFVGAKFTINPKEVRLTWSTPTTWTYDEAAHQPTATVNSSDLISGDACTVQTYSLSATSGSLYAEGKAVNVGNYTVTATALSNANYKLPTTGLTQHFSITAKGINADGSTTATGTIVLGGMPEGGFTYNGNKQIPTITVKDENGKKIPSEQYKVSYKDSRGNTVENPTEAGTYTVVITDETGTGFDNYTVSGETTFIINLAMLTITANNQTKEFGEKDPELTYSVTGLAGEDKLSGALTRDKGEGLGKYAITQGTLNLNPEVAKNYSVTFTGATFEITAKVVNETAAQKGITVETTYEGNEQVPTVIVKDNGKPLEEGKDYVLTYEDKKGQPVSKKQMEEDPDDYVAVITFIGNYEGEITEDITVRLPAIWVTAKNEWFTFSCDRDVLMPDGLTAYTCKLDPTGKTVLYYLIEEKKLTVDNKRVLKGGNGILLHGKAGTSYRFTIIGKTQINDCKQDYGETQLIPVVTETHFKKGSIYVLSENKFMPIKETQTNVPANRAVLLLPTGTKAARELALVDSGTTGVSEKVRVNSEEFATAQWYTLDGRKLDAIPTKKGLYILNGKKVVIK